ncbi:Serine/threonine-protein kinase [Ceratobasidium sp. AG-Ba]|nr:Serine/threonine-protein kinase [Ceratobasidium sp. AG-Ba]
MPSLLQRSASTYDKKHKKLDDDEPAPEMDEALEEMVVDATNVVPNGAAELSHDDGPWSISVADAHNNKSDKKKFTIYVQTPTQHLTLTRSAQEITDLHAKLRSSNPNTALPPLPGFPASGSENTDQGAKRRSSFLNTLSRLANPSPKLPKQNRIGSLNSNNNASTPMISPQAGPTEDPFNQPSVSQPSGVAPVIADDAPTEATMPALAAYLTLIGNHPVFRHSRAWRRFVRVRTDDLESVRAERVVKRVRSESGLGRNGGGASNLGRASHDVRAGQGLPEVPALPSLDASIRESVSDADSFARTEDIAEEDEDGTAEGADHTATALDKDLPSLPASNERTPSNKPGVLPDLDTSAQNGSLMPPVSAILASPSMQQAIATPLPPTTPEPQTPPRKDAPLPNVGSTTPTAQGHTLPTPDATPTASPPRDKAPAENRLSTGTDGTDNDNMFGGFANDTENEGEFGAETETDVEKVASDGEIATGAKKIKKKKEKKPAKKVVIDDFEMMRVLGKGCAGKVLLVRHRSSTDLYALKAITKRHVLAHQELQHTLTEQAVLKRMARESRDPFVVKLWWSFHDKENLFLVMDFHPGGDLATQLARWGRLGRDRARFYAAEIVEGCEGLHSAGVIYRDLKPENILIGADGHIVLTDFGLSKEFPRKHIGSSPTAPTTPNGQTGFATPHWMDAAGSPGRASTSKRLDRDMTTTFCGTAEYLAPEVIQGLPYSYEVDWWSFGTMLYEMLTGITPFWANNHSDMYVRVLQDELQFPDDKAMDQDTKSLIRGLLQRNPALRMCEPRIKKHPYFSMIDWQHVYYKRYIPPYIPPIDPLNASDTQNFDEAFLDMEPVIADDPDPTDSEHERTDESDSESARTASGGKSPERPAEEEEETVDVFDGYSFKGRHSVILDDEDEGHEGSDEEEDEEDQRVRDAEVLEPSATSGPITVDQDLSTPHHAPSELPEVESTAPAEATTPGPTTTTLPEPASPKTPTAEVPTPEAQPERQPEPEPAVVAPVPSSPKLSELPPLPAERPGELVEPPVSPTPTISPAVASGAATTATQPPRTKQKREKSGIPALDRHIDEDTEAEDDWDLIEKPNGEEAAAYNGRTGAGGKQGNSLFARGVVDRYRLAVFNRKQSTPGLRNQRAPHAVDTNVTADQAGLASPTASETKRRGRSGGLNIRKSTNKFLRARSPPATISANSNASSSRAQLPTLSSTMSAATGRSAMNNGSGLLSPAPSVPGVVPPSLKSKSSALSGTSPTSPGSSDPSISETPVGQSQSVGDLLSGEASGANDGTETLRRQSLASNKAAGSPTAEGKKTKKGKKTGTGKVLSLFTIDTKKSAN